jgi:DNA repair protein RAD16
VRYSYHNRGKQKNILQRIDLDNWRSSSKVEALVEELTRARMKDPNAKSLVFSQFVNLLDIVSGKEGENKYKELILVID